MQSIVMLKQVIGLYVVTTVKQSVNSQKKLCKLQNPQISMFWKQQHWVTSLQYTLMTKVLTQN
jgi:lysophospholipid acyltransferase (LPLAT)-like uncharacterized protein